MREPLLSEFLPGAGRRVLQRLGVFLRACVWGLLATLPTYGEGNPLRIAVFECDATPPVGAPLAYDEMTWVDQPLTCKGVAFLGEGLPVVLCALDWIGVANEGQDAWKEALAEAANTTTDRVVVHTLHQHDAPTCDFTANKILAAHGLGGEMFDPVFARRTIAAAATALQEALQAPVNVTHLGKGSGVVEMVASNRRLLGDDGKVAHTRYTTCKDPVLRAMPTGTVDPMVRCLGFYDGEVPKLVMTFFATHPQSYYRTGGANPDFPGIARQLRETETGGVPHLHFNGAGGDIGAGKWNDGAKENRVLLAQRLAAGMKVAFESMEPKAVSATDVDWAFREVALPVAESFTEDQLESTLRDPDVTPAGKIGAAAHLAWQWRRRMGHRHAFSRLGVGDAQVLFGPGELVVEYQLYAQSLKPDTWIGMAAYGDYGPGYICLTKHYDEGGYEASARASRVSPDVEEVVKPAIKALIVGEE